MIVVIAILATITIVGYAGISDRAKASSAASAAEQAAKKVLVYMTTNADQAPPDLATAGVTASGNTSLQYSSSTTATPNTFCITATSSNISYFVNNTSQTSPTVGACPGHGLNGAAPITNLATNPTAAVNLNGWEISSGDSIVAAAAGGPSGGPAATGTRVGTTGNLYVGFGLTGASVYVPVTAGGAYTSSLSAVLNSGSGVSLCILVRFYDTAGAQLDTNTVNGCTAVSVGSWKRWSRTDTAPAGAVKARAIIITSAAVAAGTQVTVTQAMVTSGGSLYNYADGATPGWIWNGAANASTSTGSPQ